MFPGEYLRIMYTLTSQTITHSRKVYSIFDLLADLGGVIYSVIIIFGILLSPVSEHNFILNASKSLFLARTKTAGIC